MICPLNIYPSGQSSAYMRPCENHPSVLKHMWGGRRGKNIEILDKNRKQQHVMSICSISVLAPDFLTLPGWLCAPAKSVHLSLPPCAKPAERLTLWGVIAKPRKVEKVEKKVKTLGGRMQRKYRNHTFTGSFLNNCYLFNNFKWLRLYV